MSGENISLTVNETKMITLKGGGTTGFSWQFTTSPEGIVKVDAMSSADFDKSKPLGFAKDDVFSITGVSKGEAIITFSFRRHWEKDVDPKRTNIFQVKVI